MENNIIDEKLIGNENNIVFYTDDEDNINIEVILQNENVWLNVESLTKLFKIDRSGITKHINNFIAFSYIGLSKIPFLLIFLKILPTIFKSSFTTPL